MSKITSTRARRTLPLLGAFVLAVFLPAPPARAADRRAILNLGLELEQRAADLAGESFDHFKGRSNEISDDEQAILFKSEAFAAGCRLFNRLAEERTDYFRDGFVRTSLFNAFTYLVGAFGELEAEMRRGRIRPSALSECRRLLDRMEREFSDWPAVDNLAYLDGKYVKARDASVWLIERKRLGTYGRRAFTDLASLFRYNYDRNRGKDPWQHLVEVPEETLRKMEEGPLITLTFEGRLVIEQSGRKNRPVYLIENGRRRGVTSPAVLTRLGGWGKVLEVPAEVIAAYPEGEPIT
jgi:hypothetical protein